MLQVQSHKTQQIIKAPDCFFNMQVADVPFEVLEALRQDGTGPSGRAARDAAKAALEQQKDFHRANRHRPSEVSSKKPVSRARDVIQVTKR